jgi:hypothetical protein
MRCETCGDDPRVDLVPPFRWQSDDNNTPRAKKRPLTWTLWAGIVHLATVSPSATGKTYVVDCRMPQSGASSYHPEEQAKRVAEIMCRRWFEGCFVDPDA